MLRVGISHEGSANPEFIALHNIDFQQLIDWRSRTDHYDDAILQKSLEKQHDQTWQHVDSQPPWKIIVNQPPASQHNAGTYFVDISFAFHHVLGDAESGLIFHRDLARALNRNVNVSPSAIDRKHDVLSIKPATNLPGPLEDVVPLRTSWVYIVCIVGFMIWSKIAPAWLRPDPAKGPWGGPKITFEPFKTSLSIIDIPDSTVSATIKKCREKGTTLTPLLHALILRSLSSRLDSTDAASFRASTPISLRRFANPGFDRLNTIHCLVTAHSFDYKESLVPTIRATGEDSDAGIWSAATSLGQSLSSKVSSLPKNDQMGLLGFVSDWKIFWADKLGTFRNESWACSNAGSLKMADAGSQANGDAWTIDRLVFTQGALPTGAAFQVSVAGVQNKGITITLSCQSGVIDEALVRAVGEDMEAALSGFASSGE